MKVFCLFEQSGTFKNEFRKLGIDAEDYDILNDFGETDHIIDLFAEIKKAYNEQESLFDEIKSEDLIFAFFPCVRFEARVPLLSRGEHFQAKNYSQKQKLEYSMKINSELHDMYSLISELVLVCINRNLQLIIENPYTAPHYLTMYWPIKPAIIDKDRTKRGDYYKKPTQYFFINRQPKNNFIWEALEETERWTVSKMRNTNGISRQVMRSLIHPQYARRFIKEFIIDENELRGSNHD